MIVENEDLVLNSFMTKSESGFRAIPFLSLADIFLSELYLKLSFEKVEADNVCALSNSGLKN